MRARTLQSCAVTVTRQKSKHLAKQSEQIIIICACIVEAIVIFRPSATAVDPKERHKELRSELKRKTKQLKSVKENSLLAQQNVDGLKNRLDVSLAFAVVLNYRKHPASRIINLIFPLPASLGY